MEYIDKAMIILIHRDRIARSGLAALHRDHPPTHTFPYVFKATGPETSLLKKMKAENSETSLGTSLKEATFSLWLTASISSLTLYWCWWFQIILCILLV